MNNPFESPAPSWSKVLPVFGFLLGFIYGKVKKDCWGCAFGYGFAGALITSAPFVIYTVRLKNKDGSSSLPPASADTASLLDAMQALAKARGKEEQFLAGKASIEKAVNELTPNERGILKATLDAFSQVAQAGKKPEEILALLTAASEKLSKQYSKATLDAFQARVDQLSKKHGVQYAIAK